MKKRLKDLPLEEKASKKEAEEKEREGMFNNRINFVKGEDFKLNANLSGWKFKGMGLVFFTLNYLSSWMEDEHVVGWWNRRMEQKSIQTTKTLKVESWIFNVIKGPLQVAWSCSELILNSITFYMAFAGLYGISFR